VVAENPYKSIKIFPGIRNSWNIKIKIKKGAIGRRFRSSAIRTDERSYKTMKNANSRTRPVRCNLKIKMLVSIVAISFVRGSSLCKKESPGTKLKK
jgi:hypothetical protein